METNELPKVDVDYRLIKKCQKLKNKLISKDCKS